MQIFTDLLIGILTTYIALTQSLAVALSPASFTDQTDTLTHTQTSGSEGFFSALPSGIGSIIPDVLRQSAKYQSETLRTR
jgi:hypothetical protein